MQISIIFLVFFKLTSFLLIIFLWFFSQYKALTMSYVYLSNLEEMTNQCSLLLRNIYFLTLTGTYSYLK